MICQAYDLPSFSLSIYGTGRTQRWATESRFDSDWRPLDRSLESSRLKAATVMHHFLERLIRVGMENAVSVNIRLFHVPCGPGLGFGGSPLGTWKPGVAR